MLLLFVVVVRRCGLWSFVVGCWLLLLCVVCVVVVVVGCCVLVVVGCFFGVVIDCCWFLSRFGCLMCFDCFLLLCVAV